MMHPFHDHLCQQLDDMLKRRSVVVFYDPKSEFRTFFDEELEVVGSGHGALPRVLIKERLTFLARYEGSFFGLRAAVEPIAAMEKPDPLVVYLPGVAREKHGRATIASGQAKESVWNVLLELDLGGKSYEPGLKSLARNLLRKKFTDGQIDEMLRPESLTYSDILSYLAQGNVAAQASLLRTLFDGSNSEALITQWLADAGKDEAMATKDAVPELLKLIASRLGLTLPQGTAVAAARDKTLRYVLAAEFRADLACDPPPSLGLVPVPPGKDELDRIIEITQLLRKKYAENYVDLSDRVASDLNLEVAPLDAAHLGHIDTFRFEERRLLEYAGQLISAKKYANALRVVEERKSSFWVDRDVGRQAQWELCRLMAELGLALETASAALPQMGSAPSGWIAAYASDVGWHQVDGLQRRMESWAATMDDEPECEKAFLLLRREHEEALKRMAEGFTRSLREAGWAVPGVLPQTRIYSDVTKGMGGNTAYFLVDALRFEMGVELARQLQGAKEVTLRPAICALPSITPLGMAALLPGASASFGVQESHGKLAATIEGTPMPGLTERLKFLKAKVPDAVDITLGKLLGTPSSKLGKLIEGSSLVVVRSQEIDGLGESDGDFLARQMMDTVISNIARAVKKLAAAGIECFVITGDHGHQFSIRKDEDMRTDNPGGDTLELHRRCWVGKGGSTPPGTVRLAGAELGYQTDLDFVFPTGLGVFRSGGGLCFHHGGFSLQELVIPVLTLRMPTPKAKALPKEAAVRLKGCPDKITNRTFGVRIQATHNMLSAEPVSVRVVLLQGSEQVGKAGMAVSGDLDRNTGVLRIKPGTEASVGLMLTCDNCPSLRVVVQDPTTDAVLQESEEIPVKLGM